MKYSLDWLLKKQVKNEVLDFLFFWGHQPRKDGELGISCLSQWWISPFDYEGHTYLTAEHWMMAEKAKLFKDSEMFEKILKANNPKSAKSLGRKVQNFDLNIWEENCYGIVKEGNLHKFQSDSNLKSFLLSTSNKIIVEASPYDKIWGIGLKKDNPKSLNPKTWNGTNLLGFALMEVRDELAK